VGHDLPTRGIHFRKIIFVRYVFFPNQACLKGFLLSLIRNAFMWGGRAVPPTHAGRFPQLLDPASPSSDDREVP
jgi:hypothetical protein